MDIVVEVQEHAIHNVDSSAGVLNLTSRSISGRPEDGCRTSSRRLTVTISSNIVRCTKGAATDS